MALTTGADGFGDEEMYCPSRDSNLVQGSQWLLPLPTPLPRTNYMELLIIIIIIIGTAIPLQAWTGPESSRRLRLPDFKTVGTLRW